MSPKPLDVLSTLDLQPTEANEDVWHSARAHVDGLHTEVINEVNRLLGRLAEPTATNPQGIVIQGEKGVGKTHLVRYARERVEALDGYFALIRLRSGRDFWRDVLDGLLESLDRRGQLERLLDRLAVRARVAATVGTAICGSDAPSKQDLDRFTVGLREHDRAVGTQSSDVARALALAVSTGDLAAQDAGRAYLNCTPGFEEDLVHWGIRTQPGPPQIVLHQLSLLMALTGPSLFAVDQIDPLLELSRKSRADETRRRGLSAHQRTIDQVALGLMELREETRRSVTVIACLPITWNEIRSHSINTTEDRFVATRPLKQLPSPEVARALVERRLTDHYEAEGFDPPYPSWPVAPKAFAKADRYTPRRLLMAIGNHIRSCVMANVITELEDLTRRSEHDGRTDLPESHTATVPTGAIAQGGTAAEKPQVEPRQAALAAIDRRWDELLSSADPAPAFDPGTEDAVLPALLSAALSALTRELRQEGQELQVDRGNGPRPRVHARLRLLVSEETEDELHWSFRGIAATHHLAVQPRIREAVEESGLLVGGPARVLVLLRNSPWPTGPKTTEMVAGFRTAGGQELALTENDARMMVALQGLLQQNPPYLDAWLVDRRPAGGLDIFRKVFGDWLQLPRTVSGSAEPAEDRPESSPGGVRQSADPSPPAVMTLGQTVRDRKPFDVPLELLRKHVLVVAGSGAGKTVLLKRLVEEAALLGVSSVVLDPNNDLSRLGQPWPQRPDGWHDGDDRKAREYFDVADVVVWTPRRTAGRPLSFEPLPDLAAFRSDPDEFQIAVESAVAVLAPKAKVAGDTHKASVARAVLTEVLRYCGRHTDGGLDAVIDLLEDVPDEAAGFEESRPLARSMATALRAAQVTDPLFGGSGGHTEPAELITPTRGRNARISVVSFIGLPRLDQRQGFVSQLQLALFAWMSRHPTQQPLGALLVMDEAQDFAPAQGKTPSTASTLRLAAQARKFGLGLAFATQAPRSLHNGVAGNTATQFVGRLTHPTQIETIADLARKRGADVPDVARLDRGQFYAATEGTTMRKISVPLPLSYHPASPPPEEDVLRLARAEPDVRA